MSPETVYEVWAPQSGAWSVWAKPVLFAQLPSVTCDTSADTTAGPWQGLEMSWPPHAHEATALIVDLPGVESVHLGLALSALGYRPVPLFNACTGPNEVVVQGGIQQALSAGTPFLGAQALAADAPPAFLLDSHRLAASCPIRPGAFDNRWQVYPEDFPTGAALRACGIVRAVIVQAGAGQLQDDVALVLWGWQEDGIAIFAKNLAADAPASPLRVPRPSWLRRLWQRLLGALGLRQSRPQGFGYVVPEPTHG